MTPIRALSVLPLVFLLLFSGMEVTGKTNPTGVFIKCDPPGTEVYIDKVLVGKASPEFQKFGLVPDQLITVTLRKKEYNPLTFKVQIQEGINRFNNLRLKPAFGYFTITGDPADAAVTIDGSPIGSMSKIERFRLKSGRHTLSVQKQGFEPVKNRVIKIFDDEHTTENITLKKHKKRTRTENPPGSKPAHSLSSTPPQNNFEETVPMSPPIPESPDLKETPKKEAAGTTKPRETEKESSLPPQQVVEETKELLKPPELFRKSNTVKESGISPTPPLKLPTVSQVAASPAVTAVTPAVKKQKPAPLPAASKLPVEKTTRGKTALPGASLKQGQEEMTPPEDTEGSETVQNYRTESEQARTKSRAVQLTTLEKTGNNKKGSKKPPAVSTKSTAPAEMADAGEEENLVTIYNPSKKSAPLNTPSLLEIKAGESVFWKNLDQRFHYVLYKTAFSMFSSYGKEEEEESDEAGPPLFSSPKLETGDGWSYRFAKPGSYSYYCFLHPLEVVGKVIVTDPTAKIEKPAVPTPAPGLKQLALAPKKSIVKNKNTPAPAKQPAPFKKEKGVLMNIPEKNKVTIHNPAEIESSLLNLPTSLSIKRGEYVLWQNWDKRFHYIAYKPQFSMFSSYGNEDEGEEEEDTAEILFTSPKLNKGDAFSFKFKDPGTYSYYCFIHPLEIVGKIIVE